MRPKERLQEEEMPQKIEAGRVCFDDKRKGSLLYMICYKQKLTDTIDAGLRIGISRIMY